MAKLKNDYIHPAAFSGYPFEKKREASFRVVGLERGTRRILQNMNIVRLKQIEGVNVWKSKGIGQARMALIDDALRRIGLALDRSQDGGVLVEISNAKRTEG